MSRVEIRRRHQHSDAELSATAAAIGAKLTERHGGSYQLGDQQLHFELPGAATATVGWNSNELVVAIELSALAALLKPMVVAEIERQLDKHLTA